MNRTHRDQVLDESRRIARLTQALAVAAEFNFSARLDDPEFETKKGPDYSAALTSLRIQIERMCRWLDGIDADLDRELYEYRMDVLRADPGAAKPMLFRMLN